jgi:diaminopropionate ammonia-lyase
VHGRLPGYQVTPLIELPALAEALDLGGLALKDESARLGLPSFKILGASWATYRLLVDRLGAEPEWHDVAGLRAAVAPLGHLTLAAATDGNHGRAVAYIARLLGLSATIFVPAGTARARIDAIVSEVATVNVVDGTYDDAVERAAAQAADDVLVVSDTAWDGYVDVPRWVIAGYATIFAEADAQGSDPDVVVVQMGVGALAAAVVHHYAGRSRVIVVEPETAACGLRSAEAGHPVKVPGPHPSVMSGLNCGTVSPVAWPAVAAGTDVFVALDDPSAECAVRDLARNGIVAGETGAAGLAGLQALAADGSFPLVGRRVLLLNTEGATDPDGYRHIVGAAAAVGNLA